MKSLTDQNKQINFPNKKFSLAFGKLLFLFAISLLLCSVGPLALFSPVPLTLVFLTHGRRSFLIGSSITIVLVFLIGLNQAALAPLSGMFLIASIYAIMLGEMITRNFHPHRIVIYGGATILSIIFILGLAFFSTSEVTLTSSIENLVKQSLSTIKASTGDKLNSSGAQGRMMKDLFDHPEKIVMEIKNWLIPFIFSGVLVSIWGCLVVIMRNALIWRSHWDYSFGMQDLLNFKTPFFLIYPLITGLVMLLAGPQGGVPLDVIGGNIVYCVGVFYFFQGFGVFSDLLTHWNLYGLLRSFVTIIFVFTAWKMLTLVGIFDVWINFRKFFINKDKGDMA